MNDIKIHQILKIVGYDNSIHNWSEAEGYANRTWFLILILPYIWYDIVLMAWKRRQYKLKGVNYNCAFPQCYQKEMKKKQKPFSIIIPIPTGHQILVYALSK